MALRFCCPVNVAVADWGPFIVTVQVELVPEHAPLQPAKPLFAFGVSVRVTWLPGAKPALHVPGQLI